MGQSQARRPGAASWGTWLIAVAAALSVPVCGLLGALLVMGTDSCSSSTSSGAFKCTPLGEQMIFILPLGLAITGAVLGFVAVGLRSVRVPASVLALVLPVAGLVGSFAIAGQDASTPPPRSVIERAEREMSGRPRFEAQETQYLAVLTEVRAAIAGQVPDLSWSEPAPYRKRCTAGPPPLDTVKGAYSGEYWASGAGPIPDVAWPAVRAAVLQIGARHGFGTVTNDFGKPGVHNLELKGPYDAVLDVGHQKGTLITLRGGTFLAEATLLCG